MYIREVIGPSRKSGHRAKRGRAGAAENRAGPGGAQNKSDRAGQWGCWIGSSQAKPSQAARFFRAKIKTFQNKRRMFFLLSPEADIHAHSRAMWIYYTQADGGLCILIFTHFPGSLSPWKSGRSGPVRSVSNSNKSDRAGQPKFEINRTGPGRAAAAVGPVRSGQFLRKIGPGRPAWSDYFPRMNEWMNGLLNFRTWTS